MIGYIFFVPDITSLGYPTISKQYIISLYVITSFYASFYIIIYPRVLQISM